MDGLISKATGSDPLKRYQSLNEVRSALLGLSPVSPKSFTALPAAGIVGPKPIVWTRTAPVATFAAYCGADKRETEWLQEPTGKCTCTECATTYPTGVTGQMLQAFCKKCGSPTTRVVSSGPVTLSRCGSCRTQMDTTGSIGYGAYYCPTCQNTTSWTSFSPYICTCLGCGHALYIEGNISGALEVFCSQCKAKTPWLVSPGGRICMWCGTKV